MTPDDVVRASTAWINVPDGAPTVETDEYLLAGFPDHFADPLQLVRFAPHRPVVEVVAEVIDRAGGFGVGSLVWRQRLDSPPEVEDLLRGHGATLVETLDVLALDLSRGLPDLQPPDVELRWATDVPTARDALMIGADVFGGLLPPPAEVYRTAARDAVGLPVGRGGSVVAYVEGEPAAAGGLSSRGRVAGLWGGAVLDAFRGRGLYRAVLAERLRYAVDHSMTMAMVKARVETSGPILRRAGFDVYGQERAYRIPL